MAKLNSRLRKAQQLIGELGITKGIRVYYAKGGSRRGWKGVITKIDTSDMRVTVNYEEKGVIQGYDPSAFVDLQDFGYSEPYILKDNHVIQDGVIDTSGNTICANSKYLVVNLTTGKVVSSEINGEEANSFAMEQITLGKYEVYGVFKLESRFRQKQPEIISESVA